MKNLQNAFSILAGLLLLLCVYLSFSLVKNEVKNIFTKNLLEGMLIIGKSTKNDYQYFSDKGGLDKNHLFYGFSITYLRTEYDANNLLKTYNLVTNYNKNTGETMGVISPYDLRQLLNKICGSKDIDWKHDSDGDGAIFKSELYSCYYEKKNGKGEIFVSKNIETPRQTSPNNQSQNVPIAVETANNPTNTESSAQPQKIPTPELNNPPSGSTSNKTVNITTDDPKNSCITDKLRLFQKRRDKQIERYKKEAEQRGEVFNIPSAESAALLIAEVSKTAASGCLSESEAQLNGKPSFDCAKAFHDDEKLICGSRNLAGMDVKLSNAYKEALFFSVDKEFFKAQSRKWIETRRQCKDLTCVERLYIEQQAHLKTQLE